ncbi:HEAT repeat domain-containing protein [Catenuloplanes atrovinosus]|uniref:HEAT repeat protein n=1 Tax=Catenuloplanes atrovinosus TaxID=137266 RepID=A0AAE3YQH2_9ACTN|nr:HEAT repeat domain-containing protein [Catenuloplanes atrovinosus]MDR7276543.1 HEAT repeat protein [Catenuloplanes atrovinosus]
MQTDMVRALGSDNPTVRLRAALAVGTRPEPALIGALIGRCAVEPDFSVRETLTWALTRHPASLTVPRLIDELAAEGAQARSQALHTLSKIGDRRAWPAITRALLTDADDEVARSAWRAAVALVPDGAEAGLAEVLATQLGRGGRDVRLSLSRALIALGDAAEPVLRAAAGAADPGVRRHALATERLAEDPEAGFDVARGEAARIVALGASDGGER